MLSQIGGKWALTLHIILLHPCVTLHFEVLPYISFIIEKKKEVHPSEVQMKEKGSALQVLHFKCPSWYVWWRIYYLPPRVNITCLKTVFKKGVT